MPSPRSTPSMTRSRASSRCATCSPTATLCRIQLALERAGLQIDHVEGFREDYAHTLRDWTARLDEHIERAEQLAGVQRTRVWRLYLRGAPQGVDTPITARYHNRD